MLNWESKHAIVITYWTESILSDHIRASQYIFESHVVYVNNLRKYLSVCFCASLEGQPLEHHTDSAAAHPLPVSLLMLLIKPAITQEHLKDTPITHSLKRPYRTLPQKYQPHFGTICTSTKMPTPLSSFPFFLASYVRLSRLMVPDSVIKQTFYHRPAG